MNLKILYKDFLHVKIFHKVIQMYEKGKEREKEKKEREENANWM